MVMIITSAAAMSFNKARKEALFLSDKMAYELSLSISQYEAVYEINLDYFLGVYDPIDLDGIFWMRRNADMRYVLTAWQWQLYTGIPDFYRPLSWVRRHSFSLIVRNRYARSYFFYDRPTIYYSFRGGHNIGIESYYAGREFHRPEAPGGQMHFGSSAPPAHGTVKPNSKSYPSYHIGDAKPATPNHGTSRSGSTTVNTNTTVNKPNTNNPNANKNVSAPTTTPSRPQTFEGSQRGNSGTTRSTQPTSAVPQRSTTPQRSATTTTTPQRSTSTTTSGSTSGSGSTRGNSGSTRGNSGGSRGR